jgi:glucoamylase
MVTMAAASALQCDLDASARTDCGELASDQTTCEASGCCWDPLDDGVSGPWCFYSKGDEPGSCFVFQNSTDTAPFSDSEVAAFQTNFLANVNVESVGAVVAAPDHDTPGGNYYYHWMRDGALSMRSLWANPKLDRDTVSTYLQSYAKWVIGRQSAVAVHDGVDVRVEPKFEIPDGTVFDGSWCRPQNDGPGLRAITLMFYAEELLEADAKDSFVTENLWTGDSSSLNGGAIKFDLDWVVDGWDSNTCDLWEEVQSSDFFWNRVTMKKAMLMGSAFATKMGDDASASKYAEIAAAIDAKLDSHWLGTFVAEETNRQKDGAVLVGFNNGFDESDGKYAPTSVEVASTVNVYNTAFCSEYKINTDDSASEVPGVLIGRYPGDNYAGGNPWVLSTAAMAQLLYRAASYTLSNGVPTDEALEQFSAGLNVDFPADAKGISQTLAAAGDSVMLRLKEHVGGDDGHLDEQIDRNTGEQMSAKDLTWSYAEVLNAMAARSEWEVAYN